MSDHDADVAALNPHDYPHCEPCALGNHDHCSGLCAPDKCCCEAPDA